MTTNDHHRLPSLLPPWLATGMGLAALVTVMPAEPEPATDYVQPTMTVSTGELAMSTGISDLADISYRPAPAIDTAPDLSRPVAAVLQAEQASSIDVTRLPAPVQIDLLFAEAGTAAKELPPGYEHPLLDETETSENSGQPTLAQWAALRWCESRGDYSATNFSGKYRGAYQFDVPTWESVGGEGDPAAATPEEQDRRALLLYQRRGSAPWPYCGKFLD